MISSLAAWKVRCILTANLATCSIYEDPREFDKSPSVIFGIDNILKRG